MENSRFIALIEARSVEGQGYYAVSPLMSFTQVANLVKRITDSVPEDGWDFQVRITEMASGVVEPISVEVIVYYHETNKFETYYEPVVIMPDEFS